MSGKRQNTEPEQLGWALPAGRRGEAPRAAGEGTEPSTARRAHESPADTERLMEEVCERENCLQALRRVKANKGSPGVDGMSVRELPDYLLQHWPAIREQLLSGTYQPQPVRRVQIDKPDGGGVRKLGVPTVLDRFIQQAVLQVLQKRWDPTFSDHSYGFRPGRSAHQAVERAQQYVADGYRWVVDLDLEKFFDRVCQDKLMARIAERVGDKRLLKLIRAVLTAGVMENGLVRARSEGTPQGGPLSPLLSNLVLDELDREVERRGHRFVRYADDSNVYVRSERAGQRVMKSLTSFITRRLKLKVNAHKSAVARPVERKFLGFSFTNTREPKRRVAPKALARFKQRVRELTCRTRGVSLERMVAELATYLRGWRSYFGFCQTPSVLEALERWLRRRLRSALWKQWKHGRTRYAELRKRDIGRDLAAKTAGSAHGPWHLANSRALSFALPNAYFDSLGLPRLIVTDPSQLAEPPDADPHVRWCGRGARVTAPPMPIFGGRRAMDSVDVCIVGGGMAGASVAHYLAPHARVILLEREPHVAYHSTGRSAALYAPNYCSELVRRLTLAGRAFLTTPPTGFANAPLLHERGFLLIGKQAQIAACEKYESEARAAGLETERLAWPAARELVPVLRAESCEWALLDRNAWDLDVDALLQGFLRGARAHGATVHTSAEAVAITRDGAGWRLSGPGYELRADVVVNAAGAWADEFAMRAGIAPLRLVPHRRTAFIFDPPPGAAIARWPMVTDAEGLFYFKPDAGRLLGSLAEEAPSAPVDAMPEDLDVAVAIDRIEQAIDYSVTRVIRSWAGLRVFAPDREAVSGFDPGARGFYWQAGLGGFGIQTAPALGAHAAAAILGQRCPQALIDCGIDAIQLAPQRLRR